MSVELRWLIRRDMPEVMSIENRSFEFPWTEEEFLCSQRQRNCIGTVAELDHRIMGFMIYELHKSMLRILNFAVDPDERRIGIGRQMVKRLIDKLSNQRRSQIMTKVRESNVTSQLFFSNNGFRATSVIRSPYEETPEDAYMMKYLLPGAEELLQPDNEHARIH